MAVVGLLSILPCIDLLGAGFKMLRISRLMMILRLLKFLRCSSEMEMPLKVLKKDRRILLSVLWIAFLHIL